MSGYIKWEDVEELLELVSIQTSYWEGSDRWQKANQELGIHLDKMKDSIVDIKDISNYNYTINFNIHSNEEKSAREFADELAKQIKLKGLS